MTGKRGIILGFGNMGQTHAARYRHLPVVIHAIVDPDAQKRQAAAAEGLAAFSALIDVPEIECVDFLDICTPTHLHFIHLVEGIRLGKAICVEKPIVLTKAEADQLRLMALTVPIFVAEVEQYNPRLSRLLEYRGTPAAITISRRIRLEFFLRGTTPWFLDPHLSGGIVHDTMIHDLHLLMAKWGRPTVQRARAASKKYPCVDEINVDLAFAAGLTANLFCTWVDSGVTEPVAVEIRIKDVRQEDVVIQCTDYGIRERPLNDDPFYRELAPFVELLNGKSVSYPLDMYLDAIDVAEEICAKMGEGI